MSELRLQRAAEVLRRGGVIAHATEAVFGLACSPFSRAACERLSALKLRARHKGFILIAADLAQLDGVVKWANAPYVEAMLASWPGPYTWILDAGREAPRWIRGAQASIAVRITNHPQAASLCRSAGPLISTSANPARRHPARSLLNVRRYFRDQLDFYLPGEIGSNLRPTPIRDARNGRSYRL